MPFFVWDGVAGEPVIKNGFKYYWIIALPLTLAVLLIWGLSIRFPWSEWLRRYRTNLSGEDMEVARLTQMKTK